MFIIEALPGPQAIQGWIQMVDGRLTPIYDVTSVAHEDGCQNSQCVTRCPDSDVFLETIKSLTDEIRKLKEELQRNRLQVPDGERCSDRGVGQSLSDGILGSKVQSSSQGKNERAHDSGQRYDATMFGSRARNGVDVFKLSTPQPLCATSSTTVSLSTPPGSTSISSVNHGDKKAKGVDSSNTSTKSTRGLDLGLTGPSETTKTTATIELSSAFRFVSTPMVNSTTSIVNSKTSMVNSITPMVNSLTPMVNSLTSMVNSTTPMVNSTTPIVSSADPMVNPFDKKLCPRSTRRIPKATKKLRK